MFSGGGFFGSGGSSTKQTSSTYESGQQLNDSTGSTAISLGNFGKNANVNMNMITTDNNAITNALEFAGRVLETQNNQQALNYDVANIGAKMVMDINEKSASQNADFLSINANQNADFLGTVSDWTKRTSDTAMEFGALSERQAKEAFDYAARENAENRSMLIDANAMVGNAWQSANTGLLNFAFDTTNKYAIMQNEATKQIASSAQTAQSATENAMKMIFESTKTADERTLTGSTKWIIGGMVALMAVFIVAPKLASN